MTFELANMRDLIGRMAGRVSWRYEKLKSAKEHNSIQTIIMAIAPITGTLKRRAALDVFIGLSLGTVGGSYYWWVFHKGKVAKREAYYKSLADAKLAEE